MQTFPELRDLQERGLEWEDKPALLCPPETASTQTRWLLHADAPQFLLIFWQAQIIHAPCCLCCFRGTWPLDWAVTSMLYMVHKYPKEWVRVQHPQSLRLLLLPNKRLLNS